MTRKILVTIFIVLMVCSMLPIISLAAEGSLADIVEQNTEQDAAASAEGSGAIQGDVYGGLAEAAVVDLDNEKAREATRGLANAVGIIVNVLAYVIAGGLALRIMIDITYIVLPFTRSTLCKQPPTGAAGQGMTQGFGGAGGYGGGGYGGGAYGAGGGYGSGGYGANQGVMGGAAQQGGVVSGLQLVSEAALRAVAASSQPLPDGSSQSPFKIYIKDMVIVLIITPILLILATNGILFGLGIKIAEALSSAISGAKFS